MLILFEADPNIPQQELNLLQIEGDFLAISELHGLKTWSSGFYPANH